MTNDDLYARFERMRDDLMTRSAAQSSTLRQVARRRTRWQATAAVAVSAVLYRFAADPDGRARSLRRQRRF